jgi:hypothetical protein
MPEYKVIDFNGEILWAKLPNGTYAVDPQYLNTFKIIILKESDESN